MPSNPSRPLDSAAIALAVAVLSAITALVASPAYATSTGGLPQPTTQQTAQQQTASMLPAGSPDAGGPATASVSRAAAAATVSYALGTDVSSYQHPSGKPIDWRAVATSGQSFTVIKATESTNYTNPYAMTDLVGARAAGLVVGLYHYANPAVSATAQADAFARQVNGIGGTMLPPVLDLEAKGGLSPTALISWTSAFLTRVQRDTGRIPMIYSGPYFWSTAMAGSKAFARYPLWEAHYTTAAEPNPAGGWPRWTLWQYSNGTFGSPAAVPGIPARVDRDRFGGTKAQLTALASTSRPGIVAPFTGTATAAQFPDGTFVRVIGDTYVYEIAGLAPLFVTSWSRVGGPHPVRQISTASFYTLRSSPLEGTFVRDLTDRHVYRIAGGAPVIVSSWTPYGGIQHYVGIDDWDIVHAGGTGPYSHLSTTVRAGTFVRTVETGQVYEVAGGAPVFVSTWSTFGGNQPYVLVNQAAVDQAGSGGIWDHMSFVPADGTVISDGSTGQLYLVTGGHPVLTDAATVGTAPFTLVGDSAIVNAGGTGVWAHLR